ncbi:acyltransferase family protein [Pseudomonas sp.]|uniref:acyltransferase family protein n=1 Tax=Pseudomonas sp. TaxID=306 RepID=UPI003F3DE875
MSDNMKGRIVFLDYMRVFAFISVLVGHKFQEELAALHSAYADNPLLRAFTGFLYNICYGGAAGVIVFFLTSGYIITYVLQKESSTEFIIKRIFRIYPLYIAAVIMEYISYYALVGTTEASLSIWIPRLLLIGDFFDTPLALANVEWTLRIEIMFYAFMAILKATGLLDKQTWLPLIMLTSTLALYALPQFPGPHIWVTGYFTLYAPFLFVGVCIYLLQERKASLLLCVSTIAIIVTFFVKKLPVFHPTWATFNFAIPAVCIFISAWAMRNKLADSSGLRLLSSMTYSIYLFHNWAWGFIALGVAKYGLPYANEKIQITLLLFIGCFVAHRVIEINSIKLGKRLTEFARSKTKHSISLEKTPSRG